MSPPGLTSSFEGLSKDLTFSEEFTLFRWFGDETDGRRLFDECFLAGDVNLRLRFDGWEDDVDDDDLWFVFDFCGEDEVVKRRLFVTRTGDVDGDRGRGLEDDNDLRLLDLELRDELDETTVTDKDRQGTNVTGRKRNKQWKQRVKGVRGTWTLFDLWSPETWMFLLKTVPVLETRTRNSNERLVFQPRNYLANGTVFHQTVLHARPNAE